MFNSLTNQKAKTIFIITIFLTLLFSSCTKEEPLVIALSKSSGSKHYINYSKWLYSLEPNVIIKNLYYMDRYQALKTLDSCDGLILTGGPDIHPFYYGRPEDTTICEIDFYRDSLEFDLIKRANKLRLPILGICRGEQILNVYYGGSLYADIPSQYEKYDSTIAHRDTIQGKAHHQIKIMEGSLLHQITNQLSGIVNSSHHQAVKLLSDSFVATAYSPEGIIEAYQWKNPENKPFLFAVQWHPERLDSNKSLSTPIGLRFLEEARKFRNMKRIG